MAEEEDQQVPDVEQEELDEQEGEELPDRDVMSVIDIGETGGLSPPAP
jgi:hypothetical protein